MQVKIVGGSSDYGRISIESTEFASTAFLNKNGQITCNVKRHSIFKRFIYKNKNNILIPRLIILFLFLISDSIRKIRKKDYLIIGLCVFVFFFLENFLSINLVVKMYSYFNVIMIFYLAALFLINIIWRGPSAKWHGAEHMAIAAYEHTGLSDIECIAAESPVNDKCGTMLVLPFIIGIIVANFISAIFDVNEIIVYLIVFECVLIIRALNIWNKIPGIVHVSYFFQKRKTTDIPDTQELLVAQRALQELVTAHCSLLNKE